MFNRSDDHRCQQRNPLSLWVVFVLLSGLTAHATPQEAGSNGSLIHSRSTAADPSDDAGETLLALGEAAPFQVAVAAKIGPKSGSTGGPGAGKRFPGSVKDAAELETKGKCVFCGRETTRETGPAQRNTDHAIPKSRGGNNTLKNAQNACRTCNLEKSAKTTLEYMKDRK